MRDDTRHQYADVIRRPLLTEKAIKMLEEGKYLFEVHPKTNKTEIGQAITSLFGVKVVKVNTYNPPLKRKKVGRFAGVKPTYKRAVVTLQEGDSIKLFPDA
ncbi:50S ribosomal protein L23 [Candidatus Cyanaurora vandensis]|uniref:50S ribosomal protein L23 n=1 Tax=Candidatus Cyanaurora vandensis TaxID=2714958 RepID=UPI00257BFDA6|nr:50S ribosomal protein L23 [Candidatus Cyanaurora vandensis]